MNVSEFDVSMLVTFHSEGILAHSTLNSLERCRRFAEESGISLEYIWVLDNVDDLTKTTVLGHPAASGNVRVIEVQCGDAGASRNAGIALATGKVIAILDGDDYFSKNWIERAWQAWRLCGPNSILHPEMIVNFGAYNSYGWHPDQSDKNFDAACLLANNVWASWILASREIFLECPYAVTNPRTTGYGYEDWHWNCETIARGHRHITVKNTVGFYRKKLRNSLVAQTNSAGALIPPTALFSNTKRRGTSNAEEAF